MNLSETTSDAHERLAMLASSMSDYAEAIQQAVAAAAAEHQEMIVGGNCIRGEDGQSPCERLRLREATWQAEVDFLEAQLRKIRSTWISPAEQQKRDVDRYGELQAKLTAATDEIVTLQSVLRSERKLADGLAQALLSYVQDPDEPGYVELEAHAEARK